LPSSTCLIAQRSKTFRSHGIVVGVCMIVLGQSPIHINHAVVNPVMQIRISKCRLDAREPQ